MVYLALGGLYVTIEHRSVGLHAEVVGGLVNLQPPLAGTLGSADSTAYLPVKDLRAAPWQAPETRLAHLVQHPLRALTGLMGEVVYLHRRPRLYVYIGVDAVKLADDVQIHVEAPLGMDPADAAEPRTPRPVA